MDRRALDLYRQELRHLRDMAWEFAQTHEKAGTRLMLSPDACGDPYVDRLLEGVAFLTARLQRKLEDEFPSFTNNLLAMVYPDCLAPLPAMAVVEAVPDLRGGPLNDGFALGRGTRLLSRLSPDTDTRCRFTTAQDVTLWPLGIPEFDHLAATSLGRYGLRPERTTRGALRLRLTTAGGIPFEALSLDRLVFYLRPEDGMGVRLFALLLGHTTEIVVQPGGESPAFRHRLGRNALTAVGFDPANALLPSGGRGLDAYRLLREYFAFHERFLFLALDGLRSAVRRTDRGDLDVFFLLDRREADLEGALEPSQVALHACPAVNLFERQAEPLPLKRGLRHHPIVVDRMRDEDYEVYACRQVVGHGEGIERRFVPFYALGDRASGSVGYYGLERRPRRLSERRVRQHSGPRTSGYQGDDVYISLVDPQAAPWPEALDRLTLRVSCTNRDLPQRMPLEVKTSHFTVETGAPVERFTCIVGPTAPKPPLAHGREAWAVIDHLALNHRSLVDDADGGPEALAALLALYGRDPAAEAVLGVASRPIARRLPLPGPITYGRGLEVCLKLDEAEPRTGRAFLLSAVLERFFARHVHLNSFTETRAVDAAGEEIVRWPPRLGDRPTL